VGKTSMFHVGPRKVLWGLGQTEYGARSSKTERDDVKWIQTEKKKSLEKFKLQGAWWRFRCENRGKVSREKKGRALPQTGKKITQKQHGGVNR